MSNQQDPNAPVHNPYQVQPLAGLPNQGMPTQQGQVGHNPMSTQGGITIINSTSDSRVLWEDGTFAVIYAKDFPANSGMGRSPTRKDVTAAIKATVDPARTQPPGQGTAMDFCKVMLQELLARPAGFRKPSVSPGMFGGRPPAKQMIASGYGSVPKGTLIPDGHFPHICGMCGGWYYQGTREHPTPDGRCPTTGKKK